MKKKETLFWKIFRWPVFLLLHPLLPILWVCEFFHDVWIHGGKDAFRQFYPHIKRDLTHIKYAWIFNFTGRDRWKEAIEAAKDHQDRTKLQYAVYYQIGYDKDKE